MSSPKYLDIGEVIAVEHVAKAVKAYTLVAEEMTAPLARSLTGQATAVRLFMETREHEAALEVLDGLIKALKGNEATLRVLKRSRTTLAREIRVADGRRKS